MRSKPVEKYGPVTIALILVVLFYLVDPKFLQKINYKNFLSSTQVVFSVLLGFLLTVSTLLHTIDNRKMRLIKAANQYADLSKYLKYSIYLNFAITSLSLVIPLVKNSSLNNPHISITVKYLFTFLVLYTLTSSIRFIRLFLVIIGSNDK